MINDKIFFDEKDPTGINYDTPFTVYGSYNGRLWSKTSAGAVKYYVQDDNKGKVLQVVSATYSTTVTVASTTYTDTGLTATITPLESTSKIWVIITQVARTAVTASNARLYSQRLLRGSDQIYEKELMIMGERDVETGFIRFPYTGDISKVDTPTIPETPVAIIYKTQIKVNITDNNTSFQAQPDSSESTITLIEIEA